MGWTKKHAEAGDKITLTGRKVKSGAPYMNLTDRANIVLADSGKEIFRTENYGTNTPKRPAAAGPPAGNYGFTPGLADFPAAPAGSRDWGIGTGRSARALARAAEAGPRFSCIQVSPRVSVYFNNGFLGGEMKSSCALFLAGAVCFVGLGVHRSGAEPRGGRHFIRPQRVEANRIPEGFESRRKRSLRQWRHARRPRSRRQR